MKKLLKLSWILVSGSSEYKKSSSVNKNVVAKINHNKYKGVLLNKKNLIHSLSRIHSKNHRIGTYKINKTCSSCFDNKIYIVNNGIDALAFAD